MLTPYKVINENVQSVTYEYNSFYTWSLYLALIAMLIGMVSEVKVLEYTGFLFVALNLLVKHLLGKNESSAIKYALKVDKVELSGNKHSFKNPLRVKVFK